MNRIAITLVLLALAGCGRPTPTVKDKVDELRFLHRLSNPTREQYDQMRRLEEDREVNQAANLLDDYYERMRRK
jgi:hypothetical protein